MRTSSFLIAIASATLLCSCQVNYYSQAIVGQLGVVRKQQPISKVVNQSSSSDELRGQLALVQELLVFAEDALLLPNDGNYTRYADLERESVLWSVFAAPELSVEPIAWTYPIFGSLDYRGYFRKEAAEAFADKLRAKGHDVAIAEVPAYSTLGWFNDPVLNTFIDWKERDLAALLFHELAHKKYYRHGDTEFSESFAVAVEQEGVRRWYRAKGDADALQKYERSLIKMNAFVDRVLSDRDALETLYASDVDDAAKRREKETRLRNLQMHVRSLLRAAGREEEDTFWLRDELNNAHLNIVAAYHEGVPKFEALLAECDGDLETFFERVKTL
tara:strand:+ start:7499 stop:8491 length:993 start_codon:yes stop_codon:yes gene_type:complete